MAALSWVTAVLFIVHGAPGAEQMNAGVCVCATKIELSPRCTKQSKTCGGCK